MKKINLSLIIGIMFFLSCQKEESSPTLNADEISQSMNSSFIDIYSVLPAFHKHLVAYYPLSGNANDKSGHHNNPSFNNATLTADRFGNANSAYSFDGNGQY